MSVGLSLPPPCPFSFSFFLFHLSEVGGDQQLGKDEAAAAALRRARVPSRSFPLADVVTVAAIAVAGRNKRVVVSDLVHFILIDPFTEKFLTFSKTN